MKPTFTTQAIHHMAPLLNGWAYIGLTNGNSRTYTRKGIKATVTPGIITLNGELPIHYINVGVWQAINQIIDKVQANGPTDWPQPKEIKDEIKPTQTRDKWIANEKRLNAKAAQAAAEKPTEWYLKADMINLKTNWNRNFNKTHHS